MTLNWFCDYKNKKDLVKTYIKKIKLVTKIASKKKEFN